MKMMNKINLLLAVICTFWACADTHVEVMVPLEKTDYLDFKKFEKILVTDFDILTSPESYKPRVDIKDFFINDFQKFIDTPVQYLEVGEAEDVKDKLADYPGALLVAGNMEVEIKDRKVIKEKKNKFGDRIKSFVKIQNWIMKMKITMTDTTSGKTLRKFSFEERLKDEEGSKEDFNFISLFNRITDKLIARVTQETGFQQRYILTK